MLSPEVCAESVDEGCLVLTSCPHGHTVPDRLSRGLCLQSQLEKSDVPSLRRVMLHP